MEPQIESTDAKFLKRIKVDGEEERTEIGRDLFLLPMRTRQESVDFAPAGGEAVVAIAAPGSHDGFASSL